MLNSRPCEKKDYHNPKSNAPRIYSKAIQAWVQKVARPPLENLRYIVADHDYFCDIIPIILLESCWNQKAKIHQIFASRQMTHWYQEFLTFLGCRFPESQKIRSRFFPLLARSDLGVTGVCSGRFEGNHFLCAREQYSSCSRLPPNKRC